LKNKIGQWKSTAQTICLPPGGHNGDIHSLNLTLTTECQNN